MSKPNFRPQARPVPPPIPTKLPASAPVNEDKPLTALNVRIAQRKGADGVEWCGWTELTRRDGTKETKTTGWWHRSRFWLEWTTLNNELKSFLFDGVGRPIVD